MEYRYRRRSVRSAARGDVNPAYYAAAALFLVIVGVIAFSPPSTWLAERVLVPAFSGESEPKTVQAEATEAEDASVTTGTRTEKQTCVLPAYTCYALQIGIYEDAENARKQAAGLMELGAAGRVTEDAGRYRVLASGYETQADAKIVQQQLAGEGIESYVYPIACAERTYTITGDAAQTDALDAALTNITNVLNELYATMIAFDRESMHASEGLLSARAIAETCEKQRDALTQLTADGAGQVRSLLTFYESLCSEASDVAQMEATEASVLSARLKALYLHAVYGRKGL